MSVEPGHFKDFAYIYACKALSDGGYNSKTYRCFVPKGSYDTIRERLLKAHERMDILHRCYAHKQEELGWPDLGELSDYAARKKLHDNSLYLSDFIRTSAPYRAYLLYNKIPLVSIINVPKTVRWREDELKDFDINWHLFDFVFN